MLEGGYDPADRAADGPVSPSGAKERDHRSGRECLGPLTGQERNQSGQIGRGDQPVTIGIGAGTAHHGSAAHIGDCDIVAVSELALQVAQVGLEHVPVAIGVAR